MSTLVATENVNVTTSKGLIEINPTLLATENITLNDVFACLTKNIPDFVDEEIVKISYKGVSFNLQGSKRNLTNELKNQIVLAYPILKGFEAYGKEYGKKIMTKFVANCVKAVTTDSLENTLKLVSILASKKSVFTEIVGLTEVCEIQAERCNALIKELKKDK